MNPKGSNQKIRDKNAWVLISTLAKPKMNGLKDTVLSQVIWTWPAIIGKTRKSMKVGMTKVVLNEASDNYISLVS